MALTLFALSPTLGLALAALTALALVGLVGIPDAGSGGADPSGGGTPAGGAGTPDPGAAGDGGDPEAPAGGDGGADPRAAADAGEPDDLDDADDPDFDLPDDVRNDPKRLRTRYRRLQRQFAAGRPILDRLRGADGRFRDVDRLLGRAQDMEDLEQVFADNPDIVQTILERRRAGGRPADPAEDAFQDPFANLEALPFDTASESGRWFVEQFRNVAKTVHELRQENKRLTTSLGRVQQSDTTRTVNDHNERWKTQALTAARELPAEARTTFVNSVWRAFELAKRDGTLDRTDVRRIIEREIAPFVRARRGQRRTDVAAQQRRAEGNRSVPAPARGATSPTDPNASNKVGTIKDGRKAFFARTGMTAPPSAR